MHIITKRTLRKFWEKHPEAENPLRSWYKVADKTDWENMVDVRKDFPHADFAGICTIFNIGGNKYRLITKISYRTRKIFVRFVLTHAEYNKGIYKNDCEC
ncbi:MAG: type II toxin-antitoxin system HigB family toxin [Pyrinomonadaceae bacterium]